MTLVRRVAYLGNLVTLSRVMFSIVPNFNIGEWERTSGEVLIFDFAIAVCSHNHWPAKETLKGCTTQHLTEVRAFI